MMNEKTARFIRQHGSDDVRQLALQGAKDPEVDLSFALQQIAGRQQARTKLPSWAAIDGILYPPHLSMEQCSSEATARYKASVAGTGGLFVDLTAGFGVDAAFISKRFERAVCIEQQPELCAISSENFKVLGLDHVEIRNGDGISYLHTLTHADLLFIDPARRDQHGSRTYGIADCQPNVLEVIDEMERKADRILLKLSPMLDWRKAVSDLGSHRVATVHIVSVCNECKELLLEMRGDAGPLRVVCVNLLANGEEERFEFMVDGERSPSTKNLPLATHLYEPNASLMKAGCFDLVAERFGLTQLDVNSHLFVADHAVEGFPGRGFIIDRRVSMNKRELRAALDGVTRANIATRNFPMSVAELHKRLKLQDGGDLYIFATTVANQGHQLFVCRKNA